MDPLGGIPCCCEGTSIDLCTDCSDLTGRYGIEVSGVDPDGDLCGGELATCSFVNRGSSSPLFFNVNVCAGYTSEFYYHSSGCSGFTCYVWVSFAVVQLPNGNWAWEVKIYIKDDATTTQEAVFYVNESAGCPSDTFAGTYSADSLWSNPSANCLCDFSSIAISITRYS